MKRCSKCGEEKPHIEFHRKRSNPDGLHYHCKPCRNESERSWRAANPDQRRRWLEANPDWHRNYYQANRKHYAELNRRRREIKAAEIAEYQRLHRAANRPRLRERDHQYYRENKDRFRANTDRWRAANPERFRHLQWRRGALQRATSFASFTQAQLEARLAVFGASCWICRSVPWTEIDHVKPLSKGGPHILANLRPACRSCNARKNARWPFNPAELRAA